VTQDWPKPPVREDGFDKGVPPDPEVCQAACDTLAGLGVFCVRRGGAEGGEEEG
jgi:hypothetical protein